MGKYLAGVDVGTTGTKALIFDLEGNALGSGYIEYSCSYPKPAWVEQDPKMLIESVFQTLSQSVAASGVDPAEIAGISVSAQRCSPVFINKYDEPIKMISWQDNRAVEETELIAKTIGVERYYQITGMPLCTTWMLPKMLWIRKNEPDIWMVTKRVVQVHDLILKALGADDFYSDIPEAALFGLWDVDNLVWSQEILDALNLDSAILPLMKPSGIQIGTLSESAAKKCSLAAGTPICTGLGDQNAATVGAGVVEAGRISVSLGTGGIAIAYCDKPVRDSNGKAMVVNHAAGAWEYEGLQNGAAGVFRWFRDEIAEGLKPIAAQQDKDIYVLLNEMIEQVPAGAKGLLVMPYFAAAAAPRWETSARGTILGLTFAHDKACLARAFMEGIVFEQKDIMTSIKSMGIELTEVRILGGATKSDVWNQIQADMYDMPVETLKITDSAVLGAAMAAGVGVGIFNGFKHASDILVKPDKRYLPIKENVEVYNSLFRIYCKAFDALKNEYIFNDLAQFQMK